jgi:hypothetical protein
MRGEGLFLLPSRDFRAGQYDRRSKGGATVQFFCILHSTDLNWCFSVAAVSGVLVKEEKGNRSDRHELAPRSPQRARG